MIKIIEVIVVLALLLFSFFVGVKYSDQVRERAGWLFETKEEEIELPNINSEGGVEIPTEDNNQYNQEVIIDDENSANTQNPGGAGNATNDNTSGRATTPLMEGPNSTKK